jgi:hypothetical protein
MGKQTHLLIERVTIELENTESTERKDCGKNDTIGK